MTCVVPSRYGVVSWPQTFPFAVSDRRFFAIAGRLMYQHSRWSFLRSFAYPAQGQSSEQQREDDFQCQDWATQTTGFDVSAAGHPLAEVPTEVESPPPVDTGSQCKRVAKGAARDSVLGGIAGNAIRGVVIGSTTSVLFGHRKVRTSEQERAAWEQTQQKMLQRERERAEAD